jgi:hypothetical protein
VRAHEVLNAHIHEPAGQPQHLHLEVDLQVLVGGLVHRECRDRLDREVRVELEQEEQDQEPRARRADGRSLLSRLRQIARHLAEVVPLLQHVAQLQPAAFVFRRGRGARRGRVQIHVFEACA